MTKSLKIYFGDDIRRLALDDSDLSIQAIKQKIQKLYPSLGNDNNNNNVDWVMKWKDEDGDLVTLTEDYELVQALQQTTELKNDTLRIWITVKKPEVDPGQVVGSLLENLFMLGTGIATTATKNYHQHHQQQHQQQQHQHHQQQQHQQQQTNQNSPNYLARCDVTNKLLSLTGTQKWFHKPGTMEDLCEEEWQKLSDKETLLFIQVLKPEDLGEQKPRYEIRRSRCFPQSEQQQRQHCSRRGNCHGGRPVSAICDVTGIRLSAGQGWYHLKGSNYDICKAIFEQLPSEQKDLYVEIINAEDYLQSEEKQQEQQQEQEKEKEKQQQEKEKEKEKERQQQQEKEKQQQQQEQEKERQQQQKLAEPKTFSSTLLFPTDFVVKGGSQITSVWKIKNTSNGSWEGVKIRPNPQNVFGLKKDIDVPTLQSGETVTIKIELNIPHCKSPTFLFSDFELIDSEGKPFGENIKIRLESQPANEVPNEKELVARLLQAGFSDIDACVDAIRESEGDLNAAALTLLRSSK